MKTRRELVQLRSVGGAPWKITPRLGFKARILAVLWQIAGGGAKTFNQVVLTLSQGGDNLWQVATSFQATNGSGCFALGMTQHVQLQANVDPALGSVDYYDNNKFSCGLPDFSWEETTMLLSVASDVDPITEAFVLYELVPV